ncbi:hypothetical protein E4S40_06790 [Algoriphagus kandeliae]|uniref:Uncharacterized protein n=1 Tax=Algoriphagus kandeliae TaxID=2562278 RepID=A0A4Y9QTL2_9BACT|nr:hypothetical protein [Algoriphagus kandeliae]TFV95924.1 hypothetical protein E4S40_06790 [Algoriphagus kandeliae]
MKAFNTNLWWLAVLGLTLGACSYMGPYETVDMINEQASAKSEFNLIPIGSQRLLNAREYEGADCASDCIVAGTGEYFVKTDSKIAEGDGTGGGGGDHGGHHEVGTTDTHEEGGGGHDGEEGEGGGVKKEIVYRAYNTASEFIVEVDYNILAESGHPNPKTTIKISINGDLAEFNEVSKGSTVSHSFPLGDDWEACDMMEFSVESHGGGPKVSWVDETYYLFDICCAPASLSYQTEDNLNIKFFYNSSEPLEDAVVQFTFPQIMPLGENGTYTAPDGKVYDVNSKGKSSVLTWIGDVRCGPGRTSFQFSVLPDCKASGKAVIWTSATVNGVDVKNKMTPNIVAGCN